MIIRKAKIQDVPGMVHLINFYAHKGDMLSRSQMQVYNGLRDYLVLESEGNILGCGALTIIWEDLAEIRSLAIAPECTGQGWGRKIVQDLLADAKELKVPTVFTLTYKPGFFEKLGFARIDKKELPHKVWKDCLQCPKFPDCDEVALQVKIKD
jgi:amino-acid N-acetyltransferase